MNLNNQQYQARELYFQTDLNQSQIAAEVGVSQKTVSLWISSGRWSTLKNMSRTTPAMMVDSMYAELIELNETIHSREPGKRFATREEADIRRKLLLGIRSIQQQQSAGSHMEVLFNFIEYLKSVAPGLTKEVTLAADGYLTGEKHLGQQKRFQAYDLPAHEASEESIQETEIEEQLELQVEAQPGQPIPPAEPTKPAPSSRRRTYTFTPPQPPRSPLLHPVTPQTVIYSTAKKKETPRPERKVPEHLKGKERQVWINYMQQRDQLLGPDTNDKPDKV